MSLRKPKEVESNVKIVPALTVEEDHWLLLQNEGPRKVLTKWLVVLLGPSPKIGQWVLMSGTSQSLESLWKWEPRRPKTIGSSWIFYGRKPEYREGRWTFVSERPELFYTLNGKVLGKRVTTNSHGDLVVADNSEDSYKCLSLHNEKGVNKVLMSLGSAEKPQKVEEKSIEVKVQAVEDFQKADWGKVISIANEFQERLQSRMKAAAIDEGNPLFHPVEAEQEKFGFLSEGIKSKAMAEIWTKDRKHRILANMSNINLTNNSFTTSIRGDQLQKFLEALKSLNDVTCLFSVNLHQVQLFFVTNLTGFNQTTCHFEVPKNVYEVQRRYSLRFSLPLNPPPIVEFDHPLSYGERYGKPFMDVSSGGMAFKANPQEIDLFAKGIDLKNMIFTVGGREIVTSSLIRHATLIMPPEGETFLKVGVSFRKCKPRDANFLNQFVYEQSLNFLSKLR